MQHCLLIGKSKRRRRRRRRRKRSRERESLRKAQKKNNS
jgi:hypothetical protein